MPHKFVIYTNKNVRHVHLLSFSVAFLCLIHLQAFGADPLFAAGDGAQQPLGLFGLSFARFSLHFPDHLR